MRESKTADALFAVQLDAFGARDGVHAFSLHHGKIATPLQRHLTRDEMMAFGWGDEPGVLLDPTFKMPAQGAATQVWGPRRRRVSAGSADSIAKTATWRAWRPDSTLSTCDGEAAARSRRSAHFMIEPVQQERRRFLAPSLDAIGDCCLSTQTARAIVGSREPPSGHDRIAPASGQSGTAQTCKGSSSSKSMAAPADPLR
ncbi:hypothetical protein [Burkholderia sp. MSMB1589WGS]|uniref:hypothetical protein n=1 Tax=Burkholderia sp. MSMB1589WGS TaxID=1636425 RepID=UPI0007B87801|nr:hypothetical protein [Burkholderia sp. MSMB1589WGS]